MRFTSWWSGRPLLLDAVVAGVTGVVVALTTVPAGADQAGVRPLDAAGVAVLAVAAAGLVVRRRLPALSLAVAIAGTLAFLTLGYPFGPIFVLPMLGMYALGAWRPTGHAVLVGGLAAAVHLPGLALVDDDDPWLTMLAAAAWLAAPVAVGIAVRARREAAARSRAEELARHRYEERLRIAREVHDVVGHSLAVISMNAGAALHVLARRPDGPQVERSLRAIRLASGGALDELRTTLATCTDGDPVGQPAARPAPGVALLPDLVAATNGGGLAVTLAESGVRPRLPAEVDLAAYRIVQESLTNVVRHADARLATVTVEYRPERVVLSVRDDGRARPTGNPAGTGLPGMRHRAQSVGGTLVAGPCPDRGYQVLAELPHGAAA